jgi:hypothetical protein
VKYEPINIISESFSSNKTGGPNKVIRNLIKGLEKINYPYVINKSIKEYKYNYIQDSIKGLIEIHINKIPAIIGPNIAVLPNNLPINIDLLQNNIYLQPSKWCIDLWQTFKINNNNIFTWPVGIDLEDFNLKKNLDSTKEHVLIYFKKRNPALLKKAISIISNLGYNPLVITYGSYNEDQYKYVLSKCKFGIWIGISESQGIGLQEALASNLPLIICDVNSLFDSYDQIEYSFPPNLKSFIPTSAPYFDSTCGLILKNFSDLEDAIKKISHNLNLYQPRNYIKNNLNLEKQAQELINFFDILQKKNTTYFHKKFRYDSKKEFKMSFKGQLIYLKFILKRKTKTLIKMFSILKQVKTNNLLPF